jgi:hypothetical protein
VDSFHDHAPTHPTDAAAVIDVAERALKAFGGDLSRERASILLRSWKYRDDLTDADRAALLDRFPTRGAVMERLTPPGTHLGEVLDFRGRSRRGDR